MDYFTPEDSASDDDAHHKRARQLMTEPMQTTDDIPFTKQEVQAALEKFDPHKAPGENALNSEILFRPSGASPSFYRSVQRMFTQRTLSKLLEEIHNTPSSETW
jgi:hypothetical protein